MDDTTALYLAAQNGYTDVARALVEVSFQWKNPDFLLKNPDFLLKNVDFITKQHKCESAFCLAQKEAAAVDFEMPSVP